MNAPLIEFRQVSKSYGPCQALRDLSFTVDKGKIHALIGENGAGKTTAMKLLFGLETPTSGQILFNGKPCLWSSPRGAMSNGIGMVHQHFMISPVHSALDNVILGREVTSDSLMKRLFFAVDRKKVRQELEELSRSVGFSIPWDQPTEQLPVGIQQQVEIIKLLHAGVETMIFDEPTAVLSPDEISQFLNLLKNLNRQGRTIIVITHKLKEVKQIADVVTVLRKGTAIDTHSAEHLTIQDMADLMVGRHVQLNEIPRPSLDSGRPIVSIENVSAMGAGSKTRLKNITLDVCEHRIVGLAGVEGSGQAEVFKLIQNPKLFIKESTQFQGCLRLFERRAESMSCGDVRRCSIGIVPADRLREAGLVNESLLENDLLGHDFEFGRYLMTLNQWIDRRAARAKLKLELQNFDVRPNDPDALLGGLSGGNQQKFVMARELSRNPKLIICAQPTRGVDCGSIEQIHGELLSRRNHGAAILLISSQLEELMALCDVIHVMFEGRVTSSFVRGDFDEQKIGVAMGGGNRG